MIAINFTTARGRLKDGKQIAIEIPDLILRRYASGGMIFTSQEKEKT